MMCSIDYDENNLQVQTFENSADVYVDDKKPTDFDIDAIIYMYERDGFEVPNRHLNNYYFKYGFEGAPIQPNNTVITRGNENDLVSSGIK